MDRVLDLLHRVKYEHDGSLTFRRSCAHGVCGSDAMLINGRNRLACKIRVDQLGQKIPVAPLPGLPVMKDLVVDMEEFFAKYRSVHAVPRQRRAAARARAPPVAGGPGALRRHDQVHPLRRLHVVVPVVLGTAGVRRARPRSSTRTASSSTRATTPRTSASRSWPTRTACGAAARSSTARTPAPRHPHHAGDPRGQRRRSWGGAPERAGAAGHRGEGAGRRTRRAARVGRNSDSRGGRGDRSRRRRPLRRGRVRGGAALPLEGPGFDPLHPSARAGRSQRSRGACDATPRRDAAASHAGRRGIGAVPRRRSPRRPG